MENEIILFEDGEISLNVKVSVEKDTVLPSKEELQKLLNEQT